MAEDKQPDLDTGQLWVAIAVVLLITGIVATFQRGGIINVDNTDGEGFSGFVVAGDIEKGKQIINKKVVEVRKDAGGVFLGEQAKRAVGTVLNGPLDTLGSTWWFVDYKNAPDGWVKESGITANVGVFRTLNIIPIILDFFRPIGIFLTIILIMAIIYIQIRFRKLIKFEHKRKEFEEEINPPGTVDGKQKEGMMPFNLPTSEVQENSNVVKNKQWVQVEKLMSSGNSSDWRQAIVEADIILDKMLEQMGYEGDSMADKLKQIEPSDFVTLNEAWEAHKVRNNIAHRGSDYVINQEEAKRVIALYEKVFKEFYYI